MSLEVHDFLTGDIARGQGIRRLALGDLMPESQRLSVLSKKKHVLTGTVGFLDYIITLHSAPPKGEADVYRAYAQQKALVVLSTGIEPTYRRKGHMKYLKGVAEQIARNAGCTLIVMSGSNSLSETMNEKLEYAKIQTGDMIKYL